jgi:hypothetical protein
MNTRSRINSPVVKVLEQSHKLIRTDVLQVDWIFVRARWKRAKYGRLAVEEMPMYPEQNLSRAQLEAISTVHKNHLVVDQKY